MANNSGPSFTTSRRGAYARLVKLGVENAMNAGWLFGRRWNKSTKKVEQPNRGNPIWPGPPTGASKAFWDRARALDRMPAEAVMPLLVGFDIETRNGIEAGWGTA